jgi:hypothetical protein
VLLIAAERDGMVSRASVQELHDRIPGDAKTFVTVPSDHTFAGDNSRSAVLQWLNPRHPRTPNGGPTANANETPLVDAPL